MADELIIRLRRKPPYVTPPAVGTPYTVRAGWSRDKVAITGHYTFQRVHIFGEPKTGQEMHLICRSGDFIDHLKRTDSGHFDETNGHKTLGDVFRSLFKGSGKEVVVPPEIADKPIPGGYVLRWNQSVADFASELARDHNAIFKPQGDKMVVLQLGSGEAATGTPLPTIDIRFDPNAAYDVELEPRWAYQDIASEWFDPGKGTSQEETGRSGSGQGQGALPHPAPSQDEAKALAEAMAKEYRRYTGTGYFEQPGMPEAVATAPAKCSGFGPPIDDVTWMASTVTHDIMPETGWWTTIETEVKPE